jgi:hypothetical protein
MALIPGLEVPAPEPIGTRYGLFTAASGPLDLPAHGEGGGVRYVPLTCGAAYAYGVQCYDVETPAPDKPHDPDSEEVVTGVFSVLSTLACSAVGYTLEEFRTKVQRRLETSEQGAVEEALWTGLDLEGNSLDILSLSEEAQNIPIGYDPALITDVVGALERYAYTTQGYGYRAYIHAPVEVAAFGHESGLVLKEGNRLVTPMGSIWSFGAYPAGSVIITGQTTVWRAPQIQVYDAFETTTNERLLVAERAYAVSFDCFAGRAEFDPLEVTSP